MSKNEFICKLTKEVIQGRYNNYKDNFDNIQLGPEPKPPVPVWRECAAEFKIQIKGFLCSVTRTIIKFIKRVISPIIQLLKPYLRPVKRIIFYYLLPKRFFRNDILKYENIGFLYNLLGNQVSHDLLVKLFAYRILGYRKIKLPRNNSGYWQDLKDMQKYKTNEAPIKIKFMDLTLALYNFKPLGFNLKVHATDPGSACVFVQKTI